MGLFNRKQNTKEVNNYKANYNLAAFAMSGHRHVQIGRESLELLRKTTNPRTFFGRYNDLVFSIQSLGSSARKVTSEKFRTGIQIEFIDQLIEADKLYLLINDLEKYKDQMTLGSLAYLELVTE